MMRIERRSPINGEIRTREIPFDPVDLAVWEAMGPEAPHIQDAFPHVSADDREFYISGLMPDEFDRICAEDDEDDQEGEPDAPAF